MAHPDVPPMTTGPGSSVSRVTVVVSELRDDSTPSAAIPGMPGAMPNPKQARPNRVAFIVVGLLLIALAAGGFFAWKQFGPTGMAGGAGAVFATEKVKDLTVSFLHPKGQLQHAMNDVLIEFRGTSSGELVDVGTVKFDLDMNMPGMVMHSGATIEPTGTSGQYRAKVKPDMGGDWMATLLYDGPHGKGSVSFLVNVKP